VRVEDVLDVRNGCFVKEVFTRSIFFFFVGYNNGSNFRFTGG
jgi:hypothetical protein